MSGKQFHLAIIGFGGMGGWHHRLIQSGIENLSVAGVYDIRNERLEAARQLGLKAYDSLESVLADSLVDIVLCATPNDCHRDIAVRALQAGKNVVSEKPVTISSTDLQTMFDAADKSGKLFVVHQNRRWDEDFLAIKRIYNEGLLGDIFNIESRVHGSRGIPGDWRQKKAQGGGMMLDWGVHIIDQMLLLIPEKIKSVYCTMTHVTNCEVDDGFTLVLTFDSGKRALLEVGTSNFITLPRWYMQGENGSAVINGFKAEGQIVRITNWDKNDAVPVQTAAGLTKTMAPRTEDTIRTEPIPTVHADVKDFYRNVMDAINGKANILITHPQMMRVMQVMEAAFESAEKKQIIPFEQ